MQRTLAFLILIPFATLVYAADDAVNIQQGAQQYDWQTCLNDKIGDCQDGCENSDDINCQNGCVQIARDKCQAMGLSAP